MDTNALQYFMEICSGITYSEVAFENNISTSTVSKSIQKLEQELDVKLFERVHRTVVLTDAGNCLYGHLKKMQPEYETLISDLRQYTNTLCINYGVIRTVNINIDRKMQEFKRLNNLKVESSDKNRLFSGRSLFPDILLAVYLQSRQQNTNQPCTV